MSDVQHLTRIRSGRPDATKINFYNCSFQHLAATGLDFITGVNHCEIKGCVFNDIGGSGIKAGFYGDLSIDFNRVTLGKKLPAGVVLISASGVMQSQDIKTILHLSNARVNAVLVGTSIMQSKNPTLMIKNLVQAGKEAST